MVGARGGVAAFVYRGWDGALWDARLQLVLHLFAVGVIVGMALYGLRGGELPRTTVDVPILLLVAAFALATLFAVNLGMSLRALGAIVAMTLMLPAALIALRARPTWTALVVYMPTLGLAAGTLVAMAGRRVGWVLAGAPGLPPLRLPAEGTPFGSVAVAPFVVLAAWAIAGQIEDRRARRAVRTALVVVGIPLAILSGSRSAWLARGHGPRSVVPWAWSRRGVVRHPWRLGPRGALAAAGMLVAAVALAVVIAPRLTAVTSVIYRGGLARHGHGVGGKADHGSRSRHHAVRSPGRGPGRDVSRQPAPLAQLGAGSPRRRRDHRARRGDRPRGDVRLGRRPVAQPRP